VAPTPWRDEIPRIVYEEIERFNHETAEEFVDVVDSEKILTLINHIVEKSQGSFDMILTERVIHRTLEAYMRWAVKVMADPELTREVLDRARRAQE